MKPLKAEVDALREVLLTPLSDFLRDSDETDTKGQRRTDEQLQTLAQKRMFEAALAAAYDEFFKRKTHGVVLRFGSGINQWFVGWHGYATRNQAVAAIEKNPQASMASGIAVVPMGHENQVAELVARLDAQPESRGDFTTVKLDALARKNGWRGKAIERDRYLGER